MGFDNKGTYYGILTFSLQKHKATYCVVYLCTATDDIYTHTHAMLLHWLTCRVIFKFNNLRQRRIGCWK